MIQFLRRLINSRFGIVFALGFLVLIALAFAAGDVANMQGNTGGGGHVAKVGKASITTTQLSQAASAAVEDMKQKDPKVSMKAFVASGGLEQLLDQLLDRTALGVFGAKYGIVASDRLVDSEIANIPAFKGPDGKFSDSAFRQMLQQRGLQEKTVRDDLSQTLIARQLLVPAGTGAEMPRDLALRYAMLLGERRVGAIGLLPSISFAPKTPPTDAQLQAFYTASRDKFIRPERRTIRYAAFGEAALKTVPAPTEAEIATRYNTNRAQYEALETRRITQLIVPTQAAAQAIVAEVAGGKRLEQAATAKGLSTAALAAISKAQLSEQSSAAVADASFGAASGSIAAPARSALGWHIMRIDGIDKRAGRSLDQARGELAAQIAIEKRRAALNDMSARLEEEFENGGNLADAAKELGLTLQQTPAILADGQVYGASDQTVPPLLARLVPTAFAMERENQPQLAEAEPGKTFVIFDVSSIAPSAPAPFTEIKGDVLTRYAMDKGVVAAKAVADKLLVEAKKGADIGSLIAGIGVPVPPVDRVDMPRAQLQAFKGNVPPPLMLLFSMAKGTTKLLPAPNNRGWYVLSLKDIVPGKVEPGNPMVAEVQTELGKMVASEYAEELGKAIRAEVGSTRNQAALQALRTQLTGNN